MKNLMAGHFPIPKPMANMLKITGFDLRMVAMDGYGSMSKPKKNWEISRNYTSQDISGFIHSLSYPYIFGRIYG